MKNNRAEGLGFRVWVFIFFLKDRPTIMECEKTHQSPRKAAKGQVFPIVSGVRYSRSNAGLKTRNLPHGWVPRMNLEPISADQVASTVQKKEKEKIFFFFFFEERARSCKHLYTTERPSSCSVRETRIQKRRFVLYSLKKTFKRPSSCSSCSEKESRIQSR